MRRTALLAAVVVVFGAGRVEASINISTESLISSRADAYVYEYATNAKNPKDEFGDTFNLPPTAVVTRSINYDAETVSRGYELRSSIASEFETSLTGTTLITASAQGSSFSDVASGEAGFYGATQSLFITNLTFFVDVPTMVDWSYIASGMSGPLGTSDGLDMRMKIEEYTDKSYSSGSRLEPDVLSVFAGAGSASESISLDPGFYRIVTQGRVLFNQPNEVNRDGDSTWSYSYTVSQATPEPPEDLNLDGFVDGRDLGILLGNWQLDVLPSEGELNGLALVDGEDLGILLGAWDPPPLPGTSFVPEPSALLLVAMAGIGLMFRRRCLEV